MQRCKEPVHNLPLCGANDTRRVEPNTGARDENPVVVSRDDAQGVSVITIVVIAALVVAVVYVALY